MREVLTISIPRDLKKELDQLMRADGVSRSDIVRESLRDYFFIRQLRRLRSRMIPQAQAKGVFTDEDVFKRVS